MGKNVSHSCILCKVTFEIVSCLYSSVAERQSCKLKVLGSIPSGGYSGNSCGEICQSALLTAHRRSRSQVSVFVCVGSTGRVPYGFFFQRQGPGPSWPVRSVVRPPAQCQPVQAGPTKPSPPARGPGPRLAPDRTGPGPGGLFRKGPELHGGEQGKPEQTHRQIRDDHSCQWCDAAK